MKPVLNAGRHLSILSATLASLAGLHAVEFAGTPQFRMIYDYDMSIADFVNQGKGWSGSTWWNNTILTNVTLAAASLVNNSTTPGISVVYTGTPLALNITGRSVSSQGITDIPSSSSFRISNSYGNTIPLSSAIAFKLWDQTNLNNPYSVNGVDVPFNHSPAISPIDRESRVEFSINEIVNGIDIAELLYDVQNRLIFTDADQPNFFSLGQFGIAITALNNANGIWQYSFDLLDETGSVNPNRIWINVDTIDTKALLLAPLADASFPDGFQHARLRFLPNPDSALPPTPFSALTFKVWDRMDEHVPFDANLHSVGSYVTLPSTAGSTSPYSDASISVTLGLNHAPMFTEANDYSYGQITVDGLSSTTFTVRELMNSQIQDYFYDADEDDLGISITQLPELGTWQYDDGDGAFDITSFDFDDGEGGARWLYLTPDTKLTYTPPLLEVFSTSLIQENPFTSLTYFTTDLSFKAWDNASNSFSGSRYPEESGGISHLSLGGVSEVTLNVTAPPLNHAPELNPDVSPYNLGSVIYSGFSSEISVSTLAYCYLDLDTDEAPPGIAILQPSTAHGLWSFKKYGDDAWTPIEGAPIGDAWYLEGNIQLQFEFNGNADGEPEILEYYGWDATDETSPPTKNGTHAPLPRLLGEFSSVSALTHTAHIALEQATQSIYFDEITSHTLGDAPFSITGISGGSSEQPVTFTSSNTSVATISSDGSIVTVVGVGSTDITAHQAGTNNYLAADDVTQTLIVNPAEIVISEINFNFPHANPEMPLSLLTVANQPFSFLAHAESLPDHAPILFSMGIGETDVPLSETNSVTVGEIEWSYTIINANTFLIQGRYLTTILEPINNFPVRIFATANNDTVPKHLDLSLTILPNTSTRFTDSLAIPSLPTTGIGEDARFSAIGGGTTLGVEHILEKFRQVDHTQARAWAWDPRIGSGGDYVELPDQPSGGLKPEHALFVVTRIDLGLDLNGVPYALPFAMTLFPGWNFLSVPPLTTDGTNIQRIHDWSNFIIQSQTGDALNFSSYVSDRPYWWNGSNYIQVDTLNSFQGYWIHNDNTTETVRLIRVPGLSVASKHTTNKALLLSARQSSVENTPPSPPSSGASSSAEDSASKACGLGSGIAGLGMMLLMALRAFVVRTGTKR